MIFHNIQSDQQENKSRVLPHLLFYRNASLSLIVHICILALHSRFIGCLLIINALTLMVKLILPLILGPSCLLNNYRKRP
jgi:hypothetical protein